MTVTRSSIAWSSPHKHRSSPFGAWEFDTYNLVNSSEMASIGHSAPYGRGGDNGGPWELRKTEHAVLASTQAIGWNFEGEVTAGYGTGFNEALPPVSSSDSQLNSLGTTAIARTTPTNPTAGLAVASGEFFSEGLPAIIGSGLLKERCNFLRGSGKDYLALEFGWKPMMADLQDFARAVKNHNKILTQYHRSSGSRIRRSYDFPSTSSTRYYSGGGVLFPTSSAAALTQILETVSSKTWFKGAFRYFLPEGNSPGARLQRFEADANKLLGLRLTPEVVWELAPWSWAVDWFSNAGDVFHNISAFSHDGLVMDYGYMMETRVRETSVTAQYLGRNLARMETRTTKIRRPSTPFGFGFDMTSLSTRQIAILASIGVTR